MSDLAVRVESFFWWQGMVDLEGISAKKATESLREFQDRLTAVLARRIDAGRLAAGDGDDEHGVADGCVAEYLPAARQGDVVEVGGYVKMIVVGF